MLQIDHQRGHHVQIKDVVLVKIQIVWRLTWKDKGVKIIKKTLNVEQYIKYIKELVFTLNTLEQTKLSKYGARLSDWRRCVQFMTPIQSLSLKCIGLFSGICVYIEVWKCGHSVICCYQL